MPDPSRDAEASIRALEVYVQALRAHLELARTSASRISVDAVPAAQLRQLARQADALAHGIERVLDGIDPGLGGDVRAIAGMMRAHVPGDDSVAPAGTGDPGRDAAAIQ